MVALHAGAWIETDLACVLSNMALVALHAGAWIETGYMEGRNFYVWSPSIRGRGLKQIASWLSQTLPKRFGEKVWWKVWCRWKVWKVWCQILINALVDICLRRYIKKTYRGHGEWSLKRTTANPKATGTCGTSYNPSVKHKVYVFNKPINSTR